MESTKREWERPCGCKVAQDTIIPVIQYCPLHKSAPKLYEALINASRFIEANVLDFVKGKQPQLKVINEALTEADEIA